MKPATKIPATVITGFLGSGKTTLVRHLLENAKGRRIALIVNEFGDIGVDREVITGCGIENCREEDVVELANGCICCTVADDFLPTMRMLLDRAEPPEHIVIETSGLAMPKPLVKAFTWPDVRARATVDGVVAVIDTPATAAGLFAADPDAVQAQRTADAALDHESPLEELFEEQIACADMIVLNKRDAVDDEGLARARVEISQHARPGAAVLEAAFGRIDPRVLLGLGAHAEDDLESRPSHHEDHDAHDHDDFESFHVDLGAVTDAESLQARIRTLAADHNVLRTKGFLALSDKPMRYVVQGVGDRVQGYFDRPWRANEPRQSRLVVIGLHGLDRAAIEAVLNG
ncbi:MAG: cobalamin biosynthesis protein CobW [Geminicoccaceae bacterium]